MHQFFDIAVAPQFSNFSLQFAPKSYDFSIEAQSSVCGDAFETNSEGKVVGAIYASGALVKIRETYMIVRAEDSSLWFADCKKHLHPLD